MIQKKDISILRIKNYFVYFHFHGFFLSHCALLLQVEAKFMGKKNIENFPDDGEPFRCCVKFEGPSVLDGVRNLASCGLANEPLPKHLLKVNSLGTNNFVLKSKDKS